jgi:hypothetical protein
VPNQIQNSVISSFSTESNDANTSLLNPVSVASSSPLSGMMTSRRKKKKKGMDMDYFSLFRGFTGK